jgi:beta-glucosidase
VALAPGQTKRVTLPVKLADLAFYSESSRRWVVDPGRYEFQVARSSDDADVVARDTVRVSGRLHPVPRVVTAKPRAAGDGARDIQSRVIYPVGATVRPRVTVAMSDDRLYGAVAKGAGRPLPRGVTVGYRSDRPGVVAVRRDGGIRTVGEGVATVTATVSDGRVRRSTDFVVRVAAQLAGIEVGGRPLHAAGHQRFAPDDYDYDVILPAGRRRAPRVTARPSSATGRVRVTQARGVPGTATITATGQDGTPYVYRVRFAHPVRGDAFSGRAPGRQWRWVRRDPANERVGGGALTIVPQTGDLAGTTNSARNLLVQRAAGDWTLESKLRFSAVPHADTQQGGILAYENDDNWLRIGWEFSGGAPRLAETIEDDRSGGPITQVLATLPTAAVLGDATTLWLRMVKHGPRYAASYSTDGRRYRLLYETGASLRDVKAGVFAFDGAGTASDLAVAFDHVHLTQDGGRPGPRR